MEGWEKSKKRSKNRKDIVFHDLDMKDLQRIIDNKADQITDKKEDEKPVIENSREPSSLRRVVFKLSGILVFSVSSVILLYLVSSK